MQITFRSAPALPNRSAHTDTQQQVAAARRLLRTAGLQRYAYQIFALLLLSAFASGCTTSGGAFKVFNDDLERMSGKPLQDAYVWNIGYLRDKVPDSVMKLQNNNEIWVYNVMVTFKLGGETQTAVVYVEVDPAARKIVQVSCRGQKCWRPD